VCVWVEPDQTSRVVALAKHNDEAHRFTQTHTQTHTHTYTHTPPSAEQDTVN